MWPKCAILIFPVVYVMAQFRQDTYHIVHEKIELEDYNRSAVVDPKFAVFYVNTSEVQAMNGSAYFTPGVKKNVLLNVVLYKFAAKKYRLFPINMTLDLCQEYGKNAFGIQSAVEHSNFRGCPCPVGLYWIYNYALEEDKFPPHIPLGKYKLRCHLRIDDNTFLMLINWYGSIVAKK